MKLYCPLCGCEVENIEGKTKIKSYCANTQTSIDIEIKPNRTVITCYEY